jgi:hypothetical protein
MHDLADQARSADILTRLDRVDVRPARVVARHWAVAFAVVIVVTALALGAVVLMRTDEPSIVEPVDRPPKVIRLADSATAAPGPVHLAVTLAPEDVNGVHEIYVVGPSGGRATLVPASKRVPRQEVRQLTSDGTRLMLQFGDAANPRLEVVNLRNGARDDLGGTLGYCPHLSPDHHTVVMWRPSDGRLQLLDTRTRELRRVPGDPAEGTPDLVSGGCNGLGWSPDGRTLLMPGAKGADSAYLVDRRGEVLDRLPDRSAVHGSMSWSPDGRRLLMYDKSAARFVIRDLQTGQESILVTPVEATQPMGWAGSRVVWLAGRPGDQRLVSTDQQGRDARTWARLAVGGRVVQEVSWSRDLAGRAADGD